MADPLARLLLASGAPAWWRPVRIVVCEGVPDWLTWASRYSDADLLAPAVLGIISGSWSQELAARVPDGAGVVVRQHPDDAGHGYAARIVATLRGRCDVRVARAASEEAA